MTVPLSWPTGRLVMVVKSAHVYQTEFRYVRGVLADVDVR